MKPFHPTSTPILTLTLTLAALAPSLGAQGSSQPVPPRAPAGLDVRETPPKLGRDGGSPAPIDVALDDAVPLPGDGPDKGTGGDPYYLGFAGGPYYPPDGERVDPLLVSQVQLHPTDGRPAPTSYAFVMFSKRITEAREKRLEALGCRILGVHPWYTLKVALPPHQIDNVAALPFVRWIGAPRDWQKVHPHLVDVAGSQPDGVPLEMIVNVYESDLCDATTREKITDGEQLDVHATVTPAADDRNAAYLVHSNGWQQAALEGMGLEVIQYVESGSVRAFRVRAPAQAIEPVAALDFVAFVEELPEAQPSHDESMPMIYSDAVRQSANGGTSQTVTAGIVDSGISTGHSDLYYHLNGWGWDFSGSGTGAWYDGCGHGTHVTGTITGDGTSNPALRGGAPGLGWGANGRFFNAKIFMGCGSQSVDLASVLSVMRSAVNDGGGGYTPRPMVINNSWGGGGSAWIGSEYNCRLIDDEVFGQRQLYVFAAGNEYNASTISQEAGAKNSFAVGSVDDYYYPGSTAPGNRSSFSSQGPMGDSRWKPNVCAPGDSVRSLLANTWSSYTNKSGTSMATPHVTGVAAQLCDNYSWLRYQPNRIASLLMATAVTRNSDPIYTQSTPGLNAYGAGRIDAWLANYGSYQTGWTNWGFDLGSGQGTYADFYVPVGTTRTVVCMTWHEGAASAGASKATNNDWDLYIDQEPFDPNLNVGEFTAGLSSFNNTEIRYIENPTPGNYRWKIHPYNATSTGHFSVTVYGLSGPVHPAADLSLYQSAYYTQPGVPVSIDAAVYNPGYLASDTWIDAYNNSGVALWGAYKYLNDGAYADMTGNVSGGWRMTLGDILSYNTRIGTFQPVWYSEGFKSFAVSSHTDNGAGETETAYVTVDGTPPSAVGTPTSTTHTPGAWSCDNNATVVWGPATDALTGVGYSYVFDQSASTVPDGWIDTYSTSASGFLATSSSPYWFHVRAVDYAGNLGPTAHAGPYYVNSTSVANYCAGKLNSQGCLPYMSWAGQASVNGPDDFHLYGYSVLNKKTGLLFWGRNYTSQPFQGGTKCVANPVMRTGSLGTGGSPSGTDCTGVLDFHWTQAYSAAHGVAEGDWIYCQFWYRDPQSPSHTGLTDALQFLICR